MCKLICGEWLQYQQGLQTCCCMLSTHLHPAVAPWPVQACICKYILLRQVLLSTYLDVDVLGFSIVASINSNLQSKTQQYAAADVTCPRPAVTWQDNCGTSISQEQAHDTGCRCCQALLTSMSLRSIEMFAYEVTLK